MGNLGRNVRAARKDRDMSQEEVERRAGLHGGTISMIEADKRDPQVSTVMRVAEALEVPPGWLLEDINEVPPAGER